MLTHSLRTAFTGRRARWLAAFPLLLGTLLLTGCFNQGPDKDSVRQILQSQIDPKGEVVVVSKIDKLNAAKKGDHWLADVDATLTFQRSADDLTRGVQDAPSGNGVHNLVQSLSQVGLVLKFGAFKKGETQPYHTRMTLIRGDQGWMLLQ